MTAWTLDADDLWLFQMYDNHDYVAEAECFNCGVPLDRVLGRRASARIAPYLLPVMLCDQCTEEHRPDLLEFRRLYDLAAERGLQLYAVMQDTTGPAPVVVRPIPEPEGRITNPVLGTYAEPVSLGDVERWLAEQR